MNEKVELESLGYGCMDSGELVDRAIEQVNLGNIVEYGDNEELDSAIVMRELIECSKNGDAVNGYLSSLSIHTPPPRKFMTLIDEKTQELAEDAVRKSDFKGKYDE